MGRTWWSENEVLKIGSSDHLLFKICCNWQTTCILIQLLHSTCAQSPGQTLRTVSYIVILNSWEYLIFTWRQSHCYNLVIFRGCNIEKPYMKTCASSTCYIFRIQGYVYNMKKFHWCFRVPIYHEYFVKMSLDVKDL